MNITFTSLSSTEPESTDGVDTRSFTVEGPLDDVPGVLWSPAGVDEPRPLVLMGHPGGLHKRAPGLVARAHHAATTYGFHVASIDAPGHGDRPRSADDQRLVDAMLAARAAGEPLEPFVVELNESIADRAVPEWRATIDALTALPQVADGVAYTGMTLATAIGVPLVVAEPRIVTAVFGGFFGAGRVLDDARRVTIPVQFILSWDDTELGRESMLALFDAFGSTTKTLRAHVGPHERVPWSEVEDSMVFVARHLA
jgi:hypothetical protein